MKIDELLKNKREEIIAIAAKHGANNVRIFGSVARGEARPLAKIFYGIMEGLSISSLNF